ncbi:MAG: PBECR4 domain-containing protein [Coprobacillus sp.]|nr:PBECR4 domain-containing protein [Coprobacillus sp.]
MDKKQNFEEWVRNTIIQSAHIYYKYLVKNHYLLYSPSFKINSIYEATADISNFKHLTGVSSELKGRQFFWKASSGSLTIDDFQISKNNLDYKQSKPIIRQKMICLRQLDSLYNSCTYATEAYQRQTFSCSFAISYKNVTLGYTTAKPHVPISIMDIDLHSKAATNEPLLILCDTSLSKKYDTLVKGTYFDIVVAYAALRTCLSDELIGEVAEEIPSILIYRDIYNYFDAFPNYIYS